MGKVKTTVYLDAAAYGRIKRIAARKGVSAADLIRSAVSDYVDREDPGRDLPPIVGAFASGDASGSERFEDALDDFGAS